MLTMSEKGKKMPESPIRKLVPFSEKAKKKGINVLHLNIGQPDILPPKNVIQKINNFKIEEITYSHSENKFKEAAEAYEVLSNSDKKSRYDQFGHQGMSGARGFGGNMNMEDIFDQFGDIFSGFGGGFRSSQNRVIKGTNLRIRIRLKLKEITEGVTKKIKIKR